MKKATATKQESDLLFTSEVCAMLGVTRQAVFALIQQGKLVPLKKSTKQNGCIFSKADVERYMLEHKKKKEQRALQKEYSQKLKEVSKEINKIIREQDNAQKGKDRYTTLVVPLYEKIDALLSPTQHR